MHAMRAIGIAFNVNAVLRRHFLAAGLALAAFGSAFPALAHSKGPVIGVSWSNFQEERWKTDEAAIKAAIEKVGGTYLSADAQSSPAKQLTDVESLIARGAKAIIVLAQDAQAIRPAVQALQDLGMHRKVQLIVSGGIRNGADVAKALALGADAVAIGTAALGALGDNDPRWAADYA
eukprot:gene29461-38003_t